MGIWDTIKSDVGAVFGSGTEQPAPAAGNVYTFSQQQKDFIKAQFKYALLLKQKLAAGEITQDYYNNALFLTTEQLDSPYVGWTDAFTNAVNSEDLNWLAGQVGETVDSLTQYMGNALSSAASKIGTLAGTAISSTSSGLLKGFFGSLNVTGWLVIAGLGVGIYWGFKKGYIQKALGTAAIAA